MAKPLYTAPTLSRRHLLRQALCLSGALVVIGAGVNVPSVNSPEVILSDLRRCGVSLSLPKTRPDLDLFSFTEDFDGCMSSAQTSGVLSRVLNNRATVAAFLRKGA